jgi:hypothetical protein
MWEWTKPRCKFPAGNSSSKHTGAETIILYLVRPQTQLPPVIKLYSSVRPNKKIKYIIKSYSKHILLLFKKGVLFTIFNNSQDE